MAVIENEDPSDTASQALAVTFPIWVFKDKGWAPAADLNDLAGQEIKMTWETASGIMSLISKVIIVIIVQKSD